MERPKSLERIEALARVAIPYITRGAPQETDGVVPYVMPWPYVPDSALAQLDQAVPDVTGKSLRDAARELHRRGFHVVIKGWGVIHHSWPAAGDSAATGATVTLFAEPPPISR